MSKNVEKIVKSLPNLVSQEHFFWSNVKGFFSLLTDFWESEKYFRDNTDKTDKRLTKLTKRYSLYYVSKLQSMSPIAKIEIAIAIPILIKS